MSGGAWWRCGEGVCGGVAGGVVGVWRGGVVAVW